MLINKPKFCKFNLSTNEPNEDSFYDGGSFLAANSVHSLSQLSCEYQQNIEENLIRRRQNTEPLLTKKYNQTKTKSMESNKMYKTSETSKETENSQNCDNIDDCNYQKKSNTKQVIGQQNESLSISEIKSINKNVSCTNFIFCSVIPAAPVKKNRKVSIDQIDEYGGNFDVLLFKNKSAMSRMQRFVTQSEYDHIAMIVKIGQSRFLLQASASSGVALSDFNSFLANYKRRLTLSPQTIRYEMAYRRVSPKCKYFKQKEGYDRSLIQFVNRVLGKKYRYSPLYLITKNYQKQQQTYFCSELIAECLKHCFSLDLETPTYKILPKDFCQNKNINQQLQINSDDNFGTVINQMYDNVKKVQKSKNLAQFR